MPRFRCNNCDHRVFVDTIRDFRPEGTLGPEPALVCPRCGQGALERPAVILALFEHEELAATLRAWVGANSCDLVWAQDGTELIVRPYSVSIVDRRLVAPETWTMFLDFIREVNDGGPLVMESGEIIEAGEDATCIMVDDLVDVGIPKLPCLVRIQPEAADMVRVVLAVVAAVTNTKEK